MVMSTDLGGGREGSGAEVGAVEEPMVGGVSGGKVAIRVVAVKGKGAEKRP